MVGEEQGRNYHVEKPSPSTGIADVFCSDGIYFPFFEIDQHGPEEGKSSAFSVVLPVVLPVPVVVPWFFNMGTKRKLR